MGGACRKTLIAAHPERGPAMRRTKQAPCDAAPMLHSAHLAHASTGPARAALPPHAAQCLLVPVAQTWRPAGPSTKQPLRAPAFIPCSGPSSQYRTRCPHLQTPASAPTPRLSTRPFSASVGGGRGPPHRAHGAHIKCALPAHSPPACSQDARSPKILAQLQVHLAETP